MKTTTTIRQTAQWVKGRYAAKWLKAYCEALFENRAVSLLPHHRREVQLLLW